MTGRTSSRFAWSLFGLCIAGFPLAMIVEAAGGRSTETPGAIVFLPVAVSFTFVGAFIVSRYPRNLVGWSMLAFVILPFGLLVGAYARSGKGGAVPPGAPWAAWFFQMSIAWSVLPLVLTMLLFPHGRPPSPRWRVVAWLALAITLLSTTVSALGVTPEFRLNFPGVRHPLPLIPAAVAQPLDGAAGALTTVVFLLAAISLIVRFRNATGEERAQVKWIAFAASAFAVVFAAMVAVVPNPVVAFVLFVPLIPIAVGTAIFKYRLYDIDLVINKTIVFGALAAFIGAVYVAVVVLLGSAIGATTTNPALSIAATAIVAMLFEPVRIRVQRVANRFVYGERATPYEVLSRFSERIAGTYATEDVLPRTARVIAEGTGAQRVGVWLRVGDTLHERGAWPAAERTPAPVAMAGRELPEFPGTAATVPIRHGDELLGAVTVTRPRGEALTPAESSLLDDLAGQAGLVLANVRLTAELQTRLDEIDRRSQELRASRQRIVTTQDAERRRLERNIHDGAQQHLVALAVKLRLIRGMLAKDPGRAATMLGELREEVDEAIETLSSLALGIYPPVLEERGIAAALESQVHVGSIPVVVDADGVDRQPIETEAAVYFCCLEAIQNAAKYAQAGRIDVRLGHVGANLTFEVRDDGVGFDTAASRAGSGLQGMADRLGALGGSVEVASSPGSGTVVSGHVPAVVFA